jgi:hypothetical protein
MKKNKLYTFEHWWKGEVALIYSARVWSKGDIIVVLEWSDFNEIDVQKIKDKQKVIFEELVQDRLSKSQDSFLMQFESSQLKYMLLENEKQQCIDIMFARVPKANLITLSHWDFSFELGELIEIQQYVKRTIVKGINDGYDFIHSPFFQYQNKNNTLAQVFAKYIWLYHQWLEDGFTYENSIEEEKKQVDNPVEVKNKHPQIFKNGYAYQMFLELRDLTVYHKKNELADYAYIFHQMKRYGFILPDVMHSTFIAILNKVYGAEISATKFTYKDQESKKAAFSTLLERFRPLIDSVP